MKRLLTQFNNWLQEPWQDTDHKWVWTVVAASIVLMLTIVASGVQAQEPTDDVTLVCTAMGTNNINEGAVRTITFNEAEGTFLYHGADAWQTDKEGYAKVRKIEFEAARITVVFRARLRTWGESRLGSSSKTGTLDRRTGIWSAVGSAYQCEVADLSTTRF